MSFKSHSKPLRSQDETGPRCRGSCPRLRSSARQRQCSGVGGNANNVQFEKTAKSLPDQPDIAQFAKAASDATSQILALMKPVLALSSAFGAAVALIYFLRIGYLPVEGLGGLVVLGGAVALVAGAMLVIVVLPWSLPAFLCAAARTQRAHAVWLRPFGARWRPNAPGKAATRPLRVTVFTATTVGAGWLLLLVVPLLDDVMPDAVVSRLPGCVWSLALVGTGLYATGYKRSAPWRGRGMSTLAGVALAAAVAIWVAAPAIGGDPTWLGNVICVVSAAAALSLALRIRFGWFGGVTHWLRTSPYRLRNWRWLGARATAVAALACGNAFPLSVFLGLILASPFREARGFEAIAMVALGLLVAMAYSAFTVGVLADVRRGWPEIVQALSGATALVLVVAVFYLQLAGHALDGVMRFVSVRMAPVDLVLQADSCATITQFGLGTSTATDGDGKPLSSCVLPAVTVESRLGERWKVRTANGVSVMVDAKSVLTWHARKPPRRLGLACDAGEECEPWPGERVLSKAKSVGR